MGNIKPIMPHNGDLTHVNASDLVIGIPLRLKVTGEFLDETYITLTKYGVDNTCRLYVIQYYKNKVLIKEFEERDLITVRRVIGALRGLYRGNFRKPPPVERQYSFSELKCTAKRHAAAVYRKLNPPMHYSEAMDILEKDNETIYTSRGSRI